MNTFQISVDENNIKKIAMMIYWVKRSEQSAGGEIFLLNKS